MTAQQPILFIVGIFLSTLAGMMLPSLVVDFFYKDPNWQTFLLSALLTGFVGLSLMLSYFPRGAFAISLRNTFLITALTWVAVSIFAALPFIFSHSTHSITDALFEAISGLTTTGASAITRVDFASPGIVLWRALLQWLGGIGIVVMALTVLPILKVGGMQLFRSEFSDRSEKFLPRASQIAQAILNTYCFFTILCFLCLRAAGMSWFDAFCHALTTISTGGFSVFDTSLAFYDSLGIECVLMVFMVLGSITMLLFVRFIHGDRLAIVKDPQVRTFLLILGLSIVAMTLYRWYHGYPFVKALRECSFHVTSLLTTTGFYTADYTLWGTFPLIGFFFLMMIGGCTGSTTGSIKVFRYQIIFSVIKAHIRQMRRPHGVFTSLYNHQRIPEEIITSVFSFVGLYLLTVACLTLGLSFFDLDLLTCLSGAVTCLNNTGPGFGPIIGPEGNFAVLPMGAKWLLMGGMILGRLEYITLIVLFVPSFWRD